MSKYGHRPHNWFEAIVNKLGGEEAAERFLRDELSVSGAAPSWYEKEGVIYLPPFVTDGTTGEEWIKRLEGKGFRVEDYAKQVLLSPDFKPTSGVTTEVAVLRGLLFEDNDRITKKIRDDADKRKLMKPDAELACLIREKFTNKEIEVMGLRYVVVMHEPINDSHDDPSLLNANCYNGGRWLGASYERPLDWWSNDSGFVFAVSQAKVSS